MSGQVRPHFVLRLCAIGIIAFTLMIVGGVAPRSVGLANPLLAQNLFNIAQSETGPDPIRSDEKPTSVSSTGMEVRFSWGGGQPQTWVGSISIEQGSLKEFVPLALSADAPASVIRRGNELKIDHWSPSDYGGADVQIDGGLDTKVRIQLGSKENPEATVEEVISLSELVDGTRGGDMDQYGNRFSVARVPGDALNVHFDKQHLVFRPQERFRFTVRPSFTNIVTRSATGSIKIVPAQPGGMTRRTFYSKSVSFSLDQSGSADESIEFEVEMPSQEGIYNIELALEPTWYQASFNMKKQVLRRRVQCVVLREQSPEIQEPQIWAPIMEVDSTATSGSSAFPGWNQLSKLAGRSVRQTIGNDLRSQTEFNDQAMMELAPGGWQAIPLDVDQTGKPHIIELEYVAVGEMALGLSVLQPNEAGQVALNGFDSGVFIPNTLVKSSQFTRDKEILTHRLTVWPKTKSPYLLIANRHQSRAAMIGKVRVLAGPDQLEASGVANVSAITHRKMMAFYETPSFAENFGSTQKSDPLISEPLDDWQMFYEGTSRLIEYLKANSYRGAFITVACDGSSIYPSDWLAASPTHDNGKFFSSGQDPIRKDVLEMMFRMFERDGLLLVPSLALAGPLPEVERTRSDDGVADFDMIDLNAIKRERMMGGNLPIYNPLSRKVQRAVTRIVEELAHRYKDHSSFDGIAIICRPDTYTLLPGRQWGYDDATVGQFLQAQPDIEVSQLNLRQRQEVRDLLLGPQRKQWRQWRAQQMTGWYQDMVSTIQRSRPAAKLYLAPVDLYRNQETASALSPSLHTSSNFAASMFDRGLDIDALQKSTLENQDSGIVLLNPHRIAPDQSLSSRRIDQAVEHSSQSNQYFKKSAVQGDLFVHRVSWAHFAQLQEQSPFGEQQAPLMRLQQMAPSGQFNRQRFVQSIKERDSRLLVDGGWMITMGQESSLKELMNVFSQLPDKKFDDVISTTHSGTKPESLPIAVRQYRQGSESYFYVANASPWPIQARLLISVESAAPPQVMSLAKTDKSQFFPVQPTEGEEKQGRYQMEFTIPAYGLIGGMSANDNFDVLDFAFALPEGSDKVLKKQVYVLQAKLIKASNPAAMGVLANPDFSSQNLPSLNGWDKGRQATGKIRLESASENLLNGQVSAGSVIMSNQDETPVWIRSNVFDGPESGRLSISVWLRTDDPQKQPPLRLAIEGMSGGESYYRFGSVGSLSPNPETNQIQSKWKRFAVHFDDLPVDGLSNVRIGFDLMGPGTVNIDHVEVFDCWFDENDAKAITQILASTGPLLSNQETFESCRQLLRGYWTQFLDRYVENEKVPESSKLPSGRLEINELPLSQESSGFTVVEDGVEGVEAGQRATMFRRFRNLVPRKATPARKLPR
ncbi:MAG: family 10 glycosylhydrolase [Mariniblastus sp.]|nr:family 10 glycosylhydrolase [Mariniblastus sp.]